ncbi:Disease resistance protein RPM1 [Sesamum angolense]|uniref:Disease resistance protein RPM1 n=1 Tax=Sesamum angolense TaxID=2727404 RepID=A0AAE2BRJ1_9LAMI|nr:Disease resistance protein RPM1 [Sesamum angolense]
MKRLVEIDSIVEELLNDRRGLKDLLPRKDFPVLGSSRHARVGKNVMVGFDEDVMELKHRLTGWESKLQAIPINGMEAWGRRYLIVLDDMWTTEVWDDLKRIFPDDVNGSRIMLTTRLLDVAVYATDSFSPPHQICLLDEEKSWHLLCQEVFGQEDCPPEFQELEDIGKMIARNCNGLPLATSVVEEVLRKFPNLKKLGVSYYADSIEDWSAYNLKNLVRLSKLENLKCAFTWPPNETFLPNLNFPQSLKKLTLIGSKLSWKDMSIIGSFPHLEVLKLRRFAFTGEVWEPVEGEFCRLKFLLIEETNLVQWIAENTHFPCLEHLIIRQCRDLEAIPSSIGDIATLKMIDIYDCSSSAVASVEQILEEQRDME